ncbi:MAG: AAA family ATPase, partial [Pseudomonadota bacterium]
MTDITSAYNVAEDIYLEPEFNDLCGFRESEIRAVVTKIVEECKLSPQKGEDALALMQAFYDGYSFSDQENELIYNPTLVLYFIKRFQRQCKFPRQMLDNNLAIDRSKLSYISGLPNGEPIISQALNENPPLNLKRLANRFGVDEMLNAAKGNTFIVSLLYYLGILTFNGKTAFGKLRFKIPNLVARQLYVEQLFELFLPQESERSQAQLLAEDFYQTGDLQALCDFMEQRYFRVFDNRDYSSANELVIKTAFLTVLFDDVFYVMDSEFPLERRYADLTMIIRPDQRKYPLYDFILEFKYLKLSEVGLSGAEVREKSIEELMALSAVEDKLAESEKQLLDYQTRLESKYGDSLLRLQLISVVAVGFERVVWQKVY